MCSVIVIFMERRQIKAVAIYVRVSTQDQSCQLQKRELEEYVAIKGWEIFKVYEDKKTGTNGKREMLKQLMDDVNNKKIDIVLCWKLDRLFRSLKDLLATLHEFSEKNIEFVSLKDQIDLTTSSGRLMMQILGAFAEFEASIIRSRVMAGLENAKAQGKKLGRAKTRPSELIRSLYEAGHSYRKIASLAGVSLGTVATEIKEMKCSEKGNSEQ